MVVFAGVFGRLQGATSSVALGIAVCESTHVNFGVAHCVVAFYAPDGCPSLLVDNAPLSDDDRLHYLEGGWHDDAPLRTLREHHAPVVVGDDVLLLPILGLGELAGSIRCHGPQLARSRGRDLTTFASYASVRFGQLQATAAPDPILARLTSRQQEVARLAAGGRTNLEIGRALAITEDTVKKHLKDIFQRIEVTTRTELASKIRPGMPPRVVPSGLTRIGKIVITRGKPSTEA